MQQEWNPQCRHLFWRYWGIPGERQKCLSLADIVKQGGECPAARVGRVIDTWQPGEQVDDRACTVKLPRTKV
ncbi:hypothetical protein AB7M22_001073 [Pseudomonas sp. ADAK2 TE3594]